MRNITKLAKYIKARDNPSPYTPMFGTIMSLPELKIKLGSRILLYADDIKATFNIYDKTYTVRGGLSDIHISITKWYFCRMDMTINS